MVIKNIIIVFHASIFELKNNFENERMKHDIITQQRTLQGINQSYISSSYNRFLPI